jgi:predicted RNA-binding protein with PIN domain
MEERREPRVWLVDGYNVVHAVLLGGRDRTQPWWTEARREQLLARVEALGIEGAEVWVVFDGPRPGPEAPAPGPRRVRCAFAPRADEWLVRRVRAARDPARVAVVTADRRLAGRARHAGAQVVTPRAFLGLDRGQPPVD